jgi:23S rRNA (pseudouridine1915-N3)-methyltransferase
LVVGKTDQDYLKQGIQEYEKRLKHYLTFNNIVIPAAKKTSAMTMHEVRIRESEHLMKNISPADCVVLLDENGKEYTSTGFSAFLNQRFSSGMKTLVFIIGGAYGVDEMIRKRANYIIALSQMTFSHQMVRLFFIEQLYRAMTILGNESYHHE